MTGREPIPATATDDRTSTGRAASICPQKFYDTGRADEQRREQKAEATLAAIRAEAAKRTGWQPWMTEEAGWGALGEDWAQQMEALDERRSRYGRDAASAAARKAATS